MNQKLVSIVLPTYNGTRYLSESIESCLNQTYSNIELIVVDDASTDETPEVVRRYSAKDKRVVYIRHEKNRRLPAALNTGFSQARGEYLSWTSDDNRYKPNAIEELVRFLDMHPDVDIVYSDYTTINEDGYKISDVVVEPPENIYMGNCYHASFVYRRAVHEKLKKYDEKLFLAEDHEYWLRAAQYFKAQPLHLNLYLYRIHPNSLSMQNEGEVLRATERVYKRYFPSMTWRSRSIPAMSWVNMVWRAFEINDVKAARRFLCHAIVCSPSFVYRKEYDLLIAHYLIGGKHHDFAELQRQLADKDTQLAQKYRQLSEPCAELSRQLAEKDRQLAEQSRQLVEKDCQTTELRVEYDRQLAEMDSQLAQKDRQTTELRVEYDRQLAEKDRQTTELRAEYDRRIEELNCRMTALCVEYDRQLVQKDHLTAELRVEHDRQLAQKDRQLAERDQGMQAILHSWSWRITSPLRKLLGMFIAKPH